MQNVKNESHAPRPRRSVTAVNIEAIQNLLETNSHLALWKIVEELNISYGCVHRIVSVDLGFRKVSARWVLRLLSEDQKQHQLEVLRRFFDRSQQEGETFLNRIVV